MTRFELLYRAIFHFEHPLHQHVRRTLLRLNPRRLLDVGGRRSNYTIGLEQVWITDIPRETDIQRTLDLGATDEIRDAVLDRRSNVHAYLYHDMSKETLFPTTAARDEYFDVVSAIEVLEHVEEDEAFVANVEKVLNPGGTFVMSTPNGDRTPTPYPDHKRHYRAVDLETLLRRYFHDVRIEHRVNAGKLFNFAHRKGGLIGMCAYALSALHERIAGPRGNLLTHHLFAVCRKKYLPPHLRDLIPAA
jgi:SAM-dependent methyltransferase